MKNEEVALKQSRNATLDLIRTVACFLVVYAHCTDPFVFVGEKVSEVAYFAVTFYRPCVPFFVMLSGALLLPLKGNPVDFFKRRFSRILIPFLIWSIFYAFIPVPGAAGEILASDPTNLLGEWVKNPVLYNLLMIPFNFTKSNVPFWFIFPLLGLYMLVPILSPWIEKTTRKGISWVLGIWVVTTFMGYLQWFVFPEIHGQCDWNEFPMLHYFSGYLGYFLLGYFLVKYNTLSMKKTLLIAVPMYIVGFVLTLLGFYWSTKQYAVTGSGKVLELFINNVTPNVLMMSASFFMVLQKINPTGWFKRFVTWISSLSYGIFLMHYIVVLWGMSFVFTWLEGLTLTASQAVWVPFIVHPLSAIVMFGITTFLTWILSKLPLRKWTIG